MKWSEGVWAQVQPIYKNILDLPFIKELMDGTLARERFIFYIRQDALYLAQYGRVLTGIASKLGNPKHVEAFIRFAGDSVAVENALHESFMRELGGDQKAEPSPSCLLYTSYLTTKLHSAPIEVAVAAVLPCFVIYKEVGDYILENQTKGENRYQDWIDTYGGEDFAKATELALSIGDQLAENCTEEQRRAMSEAFVMCSKMEWMFWHSAWNMEQWSV